MTLYLVATPIGNLADLTRRAEEVLCRVEVVACEDTRVSQKLLSHLGIGPRLISLHEHSPPSRYLEVAELALSSEVAYLTDAGTPGISDPGARLVELALIRGVSLVPIPGPSALTAALSLSPFPSRRFTFMGYPPEGKGEREAFIRELASLPHPAVIFAAPHDVEKLVALLTENLSPRRRLLVCRELTKLHEEIRLISLAEAKEKGLGVPDRGEFVLVLEGEQEPEQEYRLGREQVMELARRLVEEGLSQRSAVELVGKLFPELRGEVRRELYNR